MDDLSDEKIAFKILELCKSSTNGVLDDELDRVLNIAPEKRLQILNQLYTQHHIQAVQEQGQLKYLFQDAGQAKKLADLTQEEAKVYDVILKKRSEGLTKLEIRKNTQLSAQQCTQIIKSLEKKNLIHGHKTSKHGNNNVYLSTEYELTDETWYKDGQLETDLVQAIYSKTLQYIEQQNTASLKEIGVTLRSSGLISDLKDKDIQAIINTLLYDDKIEKLQSGQKTGEATYALSGWDNSIKSSTFNLTPCCQCPVFSECKTGNNISPESCIYFNDW